MTNSTDQQRQKKKKPKKPVNKTDRCLFKKKTQLNQFKSLKFINLKTVFWRLPNGAWQIDRLLEWPNINHVCICCISFVRTRITRIERLSASTIYCYHSYLSNLIIPIQDFSMKLDSIELPSIFYWGTKNWIR